MGITCDIVGEPYTPLKVARNSPRSVFKTAHKRCNSNDHILKFKRFTWELRATLLGNYARNARNARDAPDVGIHVNWPPHAHPAHAARPTQHTRTQPAPRTPRARCPPHAAPHARCPPRTHKEPRPRPTGIGDEARAGSERQRRRAHSLTAPAVRPDTMYFCRYWNNRITGTAAITEPAAKMPHGAVRESAAHMYMPTASVN